jgi:hypothetical protein
LRSGRVTALHTAVSDSILGREILNEDISIRRYAGAEPQSPIYVPNIHGLNKKNPNA